VEGEVMLTLTSDVMAVRDSPVTVVVATRNRAAELGENLGAAAA
jgi:hypothetical protein